MSPQLQAFAVTLLIGEGENAVMAAGALTAPSPEIAIAEFAADARGNFSGRINGVAAVPLPPEWLRSALRAIEGDGKAAVVQLVPKQERPDIHGEPYRTWGERNPRWRAPWRELNNVDNDK